MIEKNRRYFADRKRIHCSNINLHKTVSSVGLVGPCQSELIGRLTAKIDNQKAHNIQQER